MFKKLSKKRALKKAKKTEKKLQKALKKEALSLEHQPRTAYDNAVVSWETQDFLKHKKGPIWYTVLFTIFLGGALAAYLLDGWTFALVLAIFPFAYISLDRKQPKRIKVILSEVGIKVGKKIYQYNRIQAYWLHYNPPLTKTLNIRVYGEYLTDIEIQLGHADPAIIQNYLSTKIPELEGKREGFSTVLAKVLKV